MAVKLRHHRRDALISRFEADYIVKVFPDMTVSLTVFHGHDRKKVCHNGREKEIAGEGLQWLQITKRNGSCHATVLFGEEDGFREVYFDIIRGSDFSDPEDPSFEDLFLDIVYDVSGNIEILDEEELQFAVRDGNLTKEEAEDVRKKAGELCGILQEHGKQMIEEWTFLYQELRQ